MTVYVDDMHKYPMGQYRRMKMSHMIADTEAELHDMAKKIGVARRWFQGDHYDICMSKRMLAVEYGAVEVTLRELSKMALSRRSENYKGRLSIFNTEEANKKVLDRRALKKKMDGICKVLQVIAPWRQKHKGKSKREVIECPVCEGKLHLSIASSNGHVWGKCETEGCVAWME